MAENRKNPWVKVGEVMSCFDCCKSKAYQIIKSLNDELDKKGFLTYPGRVSRRYFNERFYGGA